MKMKNACYLTRVQGEIQWFMWELEIFFLPLQTLNIAYFSPYPLIILTLHPNEINNYTYIYYEGIGLE